MENETFRSRIGKLIQKSRKALRLYSSMSRIGSSRSGAADELTESQLEEWKRVNTELIRILTVAVENETPRNLAAEVFSLRDRFQHLWRITEADLHAKQRELLYSAESSDFIKASILSRELAILKAKMQASQAAYSELQQVIEKSSVTQPSTSELKQDVPAEQIIESAAREKSYATQAPQAKIIPLRKRS